MSSNQLRIDSGLLGGTLSSDGRVRVFKGIPFAAPPVGSLRWRAPQPVEPWAGVRAATHYGNAPVQPAIAADSIMRNFSFATPPECALSEDCLYLNVWTPAESSGQKKPVIVWIFGGGHRVGSGSHPISDGSHFARGGAVFVSVNYRLGALGYLAHRALTAEAGSSGNYAALDLLAALAWVNANIAAFGGDAECVTLFGQSAGAAHINVLAASARARGLFHRVIVHSAGRFKGGPMGGPMKSLAEAEKEGEQLISSLGATSAEEMRQLTADSMEGPRGMWNPIVDGAVLTASVQAVFERGDQHQVPVLAGYTADEAAPYPQLELHTRVGFERHALSTYGRRADDFLALYPHDTDTDAARSSYLLRRDTAFAYQPFQYAQRSARAGEKHVYLFNFLRQPPLPPGIHYHELTPPGGFGSFHGSELWYVFQTLESWPWNWSAQDVGMAKQMTDYWIRFATTGDPNGEGAPHWPAYAVDAPAAMLFGETAVANRPINIAALQFHDAFYNSTNE